MTFRFFFLLGSKLFVGGVSLETTEGNEFSKLLISWGCGGTIETGVLFVRLIIYCSLYWNHMIADGFFDTLLFLFDKMGTFIKPKKTPPMLV